MDIVKIIALSLAGVMLAAVLRQHSPEYGIYAALAVGILILLYISGYLQEAIRFLTSMAERTGLGARSIGILLKVMGIAYLTEFSAQLCKDAGYGAIAMKVELAGKLMILVTALPVFQSLVDLILSLLE
ncbi:MAG: stage III sporulation protein AD [Lachnospirales bacterium]|mgnify:FL=1